MNFDSSVLQVAIEDIIPNRFQPRLVFDDASLQELANSIKNHGIIQPLVLRRMGDKYEIVAGERRYRAAMLAGLASVPAVISLIDDKKSAEVAVAENVQRKELTAIEEAKSYKALLDQGYMSESQLAQRMGLPTSAITSKIKLLSLAPEVQTAVMENKISERHAKALTIVPDTAEQVKWLNRIINERLNVRALDEELRKEYGKVPMNNQIDIENVKQNAMDITAPVVDTPNMPTEFNMGSIDLGQKTTPNKFFNSLEDQAVNMQMTEAINPLSQIGSTPSENLGFTTASTEEETPSVPVASTPVMGEELTSQSMGTITPNAIDSLDTLDITPNSSISLTDAKNKINNVLNELKSLGINVDFNTTELNDQITYNITIKS